MTDFPCRKSPGIFCQAFSRVNEDWAVDKLYEIWIKFGYLTEKLPMYRDSTPQIMFSYSE